MKRPLTNDEISISEKSLLRMTKEITDLRAGLQVIKQYLDFYIKDLGDEQIEKYMEEKQLITQDIVQLEQEYMHASVKQQQLLFTKIQRLERKLQIIDTFIDYRVPRNVQKEIAQYTRQLRDAEEEINMLTNAYEITQQQIKEGVEVKQNNELTG